MLCILPIGLQQAGKSPMFSLFNGMVLTLFWIILIHICVFGLENVLIPSIKL